MNDILDNARFSRGIELFNQRAFFEAHEVWEDLWKVAEGEAKVFLQGLIQAAAAIIHARRGNRRGAASVYEKARTKLDGLPEVCSGIELGLLRLELAAYFRCAARGEDPANPPEIRFARRPSSNA